VTQDSKVVASAERPKPPNAGKGRKKGVPNKVTRDVREAIRDLLETAGPRMVEWLERVATEDPARALELVARFSEYAIPKLSRQTVRQPGAGTLEELVASSGAPTAEQREEARRIVARALPDVDDETRERIATLMAGQPRVSIVTGVPDPTQPMTGDGDDYRPVLPPRGGDAARHPAPPVRTVPEPPPPPRDDGLVERLQRLQGTATPRARPTVTGSEYDPSNP